MDMRYFIKKLTFLILALILPYFSCGHTPGAALPKDYRTIYLYEIFNDSNQTDLPDILKTSLKDEFTIDGRLIIVDDIEKADLVLALRILKYNVAPITYGQNQLPDQMAVALQVKMALQDIKTNRILRTSEMEEKSFFNNLTEPMSTESSAKEQLLENITRKILLATIEGFY